ncbi:hypothetical protein GOP47_0015928 [Adiantum capillus-veneris]|uniref:Uncharacterized protein n=1 Tax=Adiantum capillus-veneris TaxID=13818 RepID=A0A9D4ULD8_ADICA|nr:hypothetical protein GOP47_0015928 [Adiantum capillus-veneris]
MRSSPNSRNGFSSSSLRDLKEPALARFGGVGVRLSSQHKPPCTRVFDLVFLGLSSISAHVVNFDPALLLSRLHTMACTLMQDHARFCS